MKPRIPHVQAIRSKGRWYFYWRRPGFPRHPLPGDPSCQEFHQELARLNALALAPEPRMGSGSFDHLAALYLASPEFERLAPKTHKDYRRIIDLMRARFGDLPVKDLSRRFVFEFRDTMAATPRQANYVIAVLRRLLGYAINREWIAVNPAAKPELVGVRPRRAVWTAEAEAKVLAVAGPELRLAYMLGAYTAQREGDLLRMAWAQYTGDRLRLRQAKTGTLLEVPCHAALRAGLDAAPRRSPLILTTARGRAWTEHHFRHRWKAAMVKAGVEGLQFRDLRRTAIVRLAEAGATVPEIAAISGHTIDTTTRILEVYLPRNFAMAKAAILKLERNRTVRDS